MITRLLLAQSARFRYIRAMDAEEKESNGARLRVVERRVVGRGEQAEAGVLDGAAGIAFLESLRIDVAAFAGIDGRAPMRRDVLRKVTFAEALEDDF